MNKFLVLICLAFLGFIAWREKAVLPEWKSKAVALAHKLVSPGSDTTEALSDTDKPPPGADRSTVARASSTKEPAPVAVILPDPPEGVYYLRARVTVKTDSGVRGYPAGTRVTKTGENLGMAAVTDGSSSFSVEYGYLTRDMNEVVGIQTRAATANAKAPATQVAPPTPTRNAAPSPQRDRGKVERENQHRALLAQLESLDRQVYALNGEIAAAKGKQTVARANGKISSATVGVADLQKKVDQLQADRAKIVARIGALPR